jgi:hypothetical protein
MSTTIGGVSGAAFAVMPIKLSSFDRRAIRFENPPNVIGLRQKLAGEVNGRIARSCRA